MIDSRTRPGGGVELGDVAAEQVGLGVGERGPGGGDTDISVLAGEGDRDRVQGPFDQHRGSAGGQRGLVVGQPVQDVSFAEQGSLGGVEVLGPGPVVVGAVGVAAADEPADLDSGRIGGVGGGVAEHEPVAEPVDDPPAAGPGAEARGQDLVVGGTESVQIVGEGDPGVRGVAELESGVAGQVGAEPFGQVVRGPAARVVLGVERGRRGIQFDQPPPGYTVPARRCRVTPV
jgi:hypothetical protein